MVEETGCFECGGTIPFTFPAGHKIILSVPCENGCEKNTRLMCPECDKSTKVYWCTGHASHAGGPVKGRSFASRSFDEL